MSVSIKKKMVLDWIKKNADRDGRLYEIGVSILALVAAIVFVYLPFDVKIANTQDRLDAHLGRARLQKDIQYYADQIQVQRRLAANQFGINQWLEVILAGVRNSSVKLKSLEHTLLQNQVDKFQPLIVRMEIDGSFKNTYRLIHWVEAQKPLMAINKMEMRMGDFGLRSSLELSMFVSFEERHEKKT